MSDSRSGAGIYKMNLQHFVGPELKTYYLNTHTHTHTHKIVFKNYLKTKTI